VDFQTCPVTSEDDGSWICTYIPKDYTNEIRFNLSKPGYAPSSPVAHVDKTDLNNLRLVINRGFIVTGQITDMNYHPIANASIRVLDATAGAISRQQSSKTDDDGAFTLTGVAGSDVFYRVSSIGTGQSKPWEESPGCVHVDLAIQAEGFASQSVTVRLTGQTNAADFKMSPGHVFRGRVLDKAGNPVSNAMIRTDFDFKNQIRQAFDLSTNTDGEGRFEWDSAPEEEICYWFEAFGFVPVRGLALAADGTDHSIILTSTSANAK
jgi:protocatechuate 3,4-dioxygenase beta subunit